jgi:hypothetical protein
MSEVDAFLSHYGVRGMRWGKKKGKAEKTPAPRAAGYTNRMQENDRRRVGGDKGIEKVHQKVAEGKKLSKAREEVMTERYNRNAKIATGIAAGAYTAYVFGPVLKAAAGIALDQAVVAKKASNGRKHAANLFAEKRGIANYETIRLQQNPTTGNWI